MSSNKGKNSSAGKGGKGKKASKPDTEADGDEVLQAVVSARSPRGGAERDALGSWVLTMLGPYRFIPRQVQAPDDKHTKSTFGRFSLPSSPPCS